MSNRITFQYSTVATTPTLLRRQKSFQKANLSDLLLLTESNHDNDVQEEETIRETQVVYLEVRQTS